MLYDIGFVLLALISPVLVMIAYRQGVKDRIQQDKSEPLQPFFNVTHSPKQSREDTRIQTILDNINSYDGTERGQKDVIN
jgi:hypothetical protein